MARRIRGTTSPHWTNCVNRFQDKHHQHHAQVEPCDVCWLNLTITDQPIRNHHASVFSFFKILDVCSFSNTRRQKIVVSNRTLFLYNDLASLPSGAQHTQVQEHNFAHKVHLPQMCHNGPHKSRCVPFCLALRCSVISEIALEDTLLTLLLWNCSTSDR